MGVFSVIYISANHPNFIIMDSSARFIDYFEYIYDMLVIIKI